MPGGAVGVRSGELGGHASCDEGVSRHGSLRSYAPLPLQSAKSMQPWPWPGGIAGYATPGTHSESDEGDGGKGDEGGGGGGDGTR